MNKICTSIEQSQKLIELGINVTTADMWYHGHGSPWESEREYDSDACPFHSMRPNWDIPAWSLTVLFNMLPKSAYLERGSSTELCRVNLPVELKCSDWYLEPIDAVFEIVCILKKEKYI